MESGHRGGASCVGPVVDEGAVAFGNQEDTLDGLGSIS